MNMKHLTQSEKRREDQLQEWARWEFGLTYTEFCVCVALVVDWRMWGIPLTTEEVETFIRRVESRHAEHSLRKLHRKGLAIFEGKNGVRMLWRPSRRLLKLFPVMGPGVADASRVVNEAPLAEVG